MRINIYSQELTEEVQEVEKVSNTGIAYRAAMLMLHSSPMLHHPPNDDDRSAVVFWLPTSARLRKQMGAAFRRIAEIFEKGIEEDQHLKEAGWPLSILDGKTDPTPAAPASRRQRRSRLLRSSLK